MTATLVVTDRLRIGAGPPSASFRAHLDTHGPLNVPVGDRRWKGAVLDVVAASGLFGRGGAGFPSAAKWEACAKASRRSVVVINALEGEPASAKDRVLVTRCPHLVLDGAEAVAAVLGASEIVVCVPDHNRSLAESVRAAVDERVRAGSARFLISVRCPPGGYVSGEESALVDWLNGGAGRPVMRTNKAIPLRLDRRPVLVHNAETMAHIALIARHGPDWFRQAGTEDAPGTTLVTVTGGPSGPAVFEVALGMPVADILARAGIEGAVPAVLLGGYGGTWCGAPRLDTPFTPRALASIGATMGGWACSSPSPLGVRHRRDGPDRPVPGRGERRSVRPVRVRSAGHRRGPRRLDGRPGRPGAPRTHHPTGRHGGRERRLPSS